MLSGSRECCENTITNSGVVGRKELEDLRLDPWATRRRRNLPELLDQLDPWIEQLDQAVAQEAERCREAVYLMKQPGVGPVTALAFVLTIGPVSRFPNSKKVVSYLGLNPSEDSSAGRQRLGAISKQGNSMMRTRGSDQTRQSPVAIPLGEAGAHAVRRDPELKRFYCRKLVQKGLGKARVAVARKLGIRLWIMLRDEIDYHSRPKTNATQHCVQSAKINESSKGR
jgi:transposase